MVQMLHNSFPASTCSTPSRFCFTWCSADKRAAKKAAILASEGSSTGEHQHPSAQPVCPGAQPWQAGGTAAASLRDATMHQAELTAILPGRTSTEGQSGKTKKPKPSEPSAGVSSGEQQQPEAHADQSGSGEGVGTLVEGAHREESNSSFAAPASYAIGLGEPPTRPNSASRALHQAKSD